MSDKILFQFEADFAENLHCIPMIVRFKLDHVGIKLSLKQWSHFQFEERYQLVDLPCSTVDQTEFYSRYLTQLIAERAKEVAVTIETEIDAEWSTTDVIPERVIKQATDLGIKPPHVNEWSALNPLQRFTLCKLSRAGHDNDNFIPAMREFGLLRDAIYPNADNAKSAISGEID